MTFEHPTGKSPKRVVLIAAGPSKAEWVNACSSLAIEGGMPDEVWGLNTVPRGIPCDVCFIMDDYLTFKGHMPQFAEWMQTCPVPLFTSRAYPELPTSIRYPLADVLSMTGARPFFNHTVSYMIAYAILIGVKEIMLFGADYIANDYKTGMEVQHGSARFMGCASFWLGMAAGRGISVAVAPKSPLLDADIHQDQWFYGYFPKPVVQFHMGDPNDVTNPPVPVSPPLRAVQG